MAGSSDGNGVIKTVLVAIVIALATGGTAPFWWQYVFPSHSSQPPSSTSDVKDAPVDPPKIAGVGACRSGLSPSDQFHDVAAPGNDWDWNCDGRITREYGVCENLAPEQCQPNTNATHNQPGFCSELRGTLGCVPKAGECGQSGYIYPCFYTPSDGRCHAGGYETATVMRCK